MTSMLDSNGNRRAVTAGQRVRVWDGSEAHGDYGAVWAIQADGLVLVELDEGCIWPVDAWDCEVVP